jgi:hypothetical protein
VGRWIVNESFLGSVPPIPRTYIGPKSQYNLAQGSIKQERLSFALLQRPTRNVTRLRVLASRDATRPGSILSAEVTTWCPSCNPQRKTSGKLSRSEIDLSDITYLLTPEYQILKGFFWHYRPRTSAAEWSCICSVAMVKGWYRNLSFS